MYKLTPSFSYKPIPCDLTMLTARCRQLLSKSQCVYEDLTPKFTVPKLEYDKQYLSCFGPSFHLPVNFPGCGADEYRCGISRLIKLRKPDRPGYSERLVRNQERSLYTLRCSLHRFKMWFESKVERTDYAEGYPLWLHKKHIKRQLRYRTDVDAYFVGTDKMDDSLPVQYNLKKDELLESVDKIRSIGDLGAMRTQATAWCWDQIKTGMSGDYNNGSYTYRFVKEPNKDELLDVFRRLTVLPFGSVFFVYFSDDCCLGAHCSDGIVFFNGDISTCDGSHYTKFLRFCSKFYSHTNGLPNVHHGAVDRAYGYLRRKLVMRNKTKGVKEKVQYEFSTDRMWSGFTGTTVTNNMANMMIGLMLQHLIPDASRVSKAFFTEGYVRAAEQCGYIVKVGKCDVVEDLLFLKHWYTVVDGVDTVCMALGVEVRGYGWFKGELPKVSHLGRSGGSYEDRALNYRHDIAVSRRDWGDHDLRIAMNSHKLDNSNKVRMTGRAYGAALTAQVGKSTGKSGVFIPIENVLKRYRSTTYHDFVDMCQMLKDGRSGDVIHSAAAVSLYLTDYG